VSQGSTLSLCAPQPQRASAPGSVGPPRHPVWHQTAARPWQSVCQRGSGASTACPWAPQASPSGGSKMCRGWEGTRPPPVRHWKPCRPQGHRGRVYSVCTGVGRAGGCRGLPAAGPHRGGRCHGGTGLLPRPSLRAGRSSLRRQGSESKRVRWRDSHGDVLVTIREFNIR